MERGFLNEKRYIRFETRVPRGGREGGGNLIKDQFYINWKNDGGSFEYTEEQWLAMVKDYRG